MDLARYEQLHVIRAPLMRTYLHSIQTNNDWYATCVGLISRRNDEWERPSFCGYGAQLLYSELINYWYHCAMTNTSTAYRTYLSVVWQFGRPHCRTLVSKLVIGVHNKWHYLAAGHLHSRVSAVTPRVEHRYIQRVRCTGQVFWLIPTPVIHELSYLISSVSTRTAACSIPSFLTPTHFNTTPPCMHAMREGCNGACIDRSMFQVQLHNVLRR